MTGLAAITPAIAGVAQTLVGRVLNSLPEGLLLALSAWLLLRVLGRQNARTRFAVWIVALTGVAVLPFLGGGASVAHAAGIGSHAEFVVPAFAAILFISLWIPLAAIALARVLFGLWQVRAIRRECVEIDPATLAPALRDTLRSSAAGRRVRLLVSETARVPAALGFHRAAIVLPAWCLREMSPAEIQPILIHELAHLERRDDWTNLLQKLVRAVLFFHPAVWWIDRRLAVEREMACDDAVLAALGNARAYAGSLVGLLERSCARRGWTMAQAAVSRAREVSQRIARILSGGAASTRIGRGALGLAAALCAASFGVFALAPQLVGFAPDTELASAPAPGQTKNVLRIHGDLYHAAVVPAAYHPRQISSKSMLAHRAVVKTTARTTPAPLVAIATRPAHRAPAMVMAKLDAPESANAGAENALTQEPMVMLFETAEAGAAPVPHAASAGSSAAAASPVAPPAVLAAASGILQIRTLQVLEEDDSGWHLHIYHIVVVVPVGAEGSQHSST
ncbi:MAG TPA: M56 family metallopeptidase [Acidobacteriaceae bacterium]|nr:M56 family metallopeptidase [Acidobacteriaceae bacterium]